jgi:hypothetical protein
MEMVGLLAFVAFVVIAILAWGFYYTHCEYRSKSQERELAHAERIKALESGFPLPDAEIAWAAAERTRGRMAGLVGIFVPVLTGIAAYGATAILVSLGGRDDANNVLPFGNLGAPWYGKVLFVIWPTWGVVSVVTGVLSVLALRRRNAPPPAAGRQAPAVAHRTGSEPVLASIAEGPPRP